MRIKTRRRSFSNNRFFTHTLEYLAVLAGCLLLALSFNVLLAPNRIASGGVVGISVIVRELSGVEPAVTQWSLNIPLFVLGLFFLGRKFGIKTIVATFILPLFILLTSKLPPLTENLMLAAIFGGAGAGMGLGIVFRGKGSTGGLSILAQIIHNKTGISIGGSIMVIDFSIIVASGIVFGPEKALYALISLFITGKAIDVMQTGFVFSKVAFVISEKHEEISDIVLKHLDRGLTKLSGFGGYTGKEQTVLMVVMGSAEVSQFKALVKAEDPYAFIIISDTNEVLGKGFKLSHGNDASALKQNLKHLHQ